MKKTAAALFVLSFALSSAAQAPAGPAPHTVHNKSSNSRKAYLKQQKKQQKKMRKQQKKDQKNLKKRHSANR
ncbi:MAG: hypothetical protein ACLQMO_13690 [Acidobacteriaceae bacterium]